jgi:8-oxo-dGTP pyrophosphatase MutT (NUDIX family)
MRRDKLIHRATYAFVRTSSNYFFVQKRSSIKDYCPNFYDPTPGGVVAAGESYDATNAREVMEEMAIDTKNWSHLFTFYYEDEQIKCFGDAWETTYDGPIRIQKEEVQDVEMMTMQEILDRAKSGEDFTPDSIFACEEYVKQKGIPVPVGNRHEVVYFTEEDTAM